MSIPSYKHWRTTTGHLYQTLEDVATVVQDGARWGGRTEGRRRRRGKREGGGGVGREKGVRGGMGREKGVRGGEGGVEA